MQTFLLLRGPMGVGKSATARALGKRLGWPVVDKDDASDVLLGYMESYGPVAYEIMFRQAEALLLQGFNVIVDSPLRGEIGYHQALAFGEHYSLKVAVLDCQCKDQTMWKNRLETRARRPAHILKNWADFEAYWEKVKKDFDYPFSSPYLELDTSQALETNITKVVNWLL